jgi:putative heme transporter
MIRGATFEASLTRVSAPPDAVAEPQPLELDDEEIRRLSATWRTPRWLADLGRTSWFLVGVLLVLVGLIWLLAETAQISNPLTAAAIVAAVASPLVARLEPHIGRTAGAAVVLVAGAILAVLIFVAVIGGIVGQSGEIGAQASSALDHLRSELKSAGLSTSAADSISANLRSAVPAMISTLVHGVVHGIRGIASLAFGLSLAALSFFFLLRDGPHIRRFVNAHIGVPTPVGAAITGQTISSLRGYFRGVTIVAAFNGIVVGLGALLLDVPLAGTIAIVTFVTAYIPYIGAFAAGAFAVVLALGAHGAGIALAMLVIVLLANGLLQNILSPFAMGSALHLNPLLVLVVTIGAGCLFGTLGLILAAPLTSAAVQLTATLSATRAAALDAHTD